MKRGILFLVILALLTPEGVIAAPNLLGKVMTESGEPLADVRVDAEVSGQAFSTVTDYNGVFSISVLPPASRRVSVSFILTRKNYDKLSITLPYWSPAEIPSLDIGRVQLVASSGGTSLSVEETAYYASMRSQEGNTLFLLPFKMVPADQPGAGIDTVNIADAMQLAIGNWFQALEDRVVELLKTKNYKPFEPVGVVPLIPHKAGLIPSDVEKVKKVGKELNALAVVGGQGRFWKGRPT